MSCHSPRLAHTVHSIPKAEAVHSRNSMAVYTASYSLGTEDEWTLMALQVVLFSHQIKVSMKLVSAKHYEEWAD